MRWHWWAFAWVQPLLVCRLFLPTFLSRLTLASAMALAGDYTGVPRDDGVPDTVRAAVGSLRKRGCTVSFDKDGDFSSATALWTLREAPSRIGIWRRVNLIPNITWLTVRNANVTQAGLLRITDAKWAGLSELIVEGIPIRRLLSVKIPVMRRLTRLVANRADLNDECVGTLKNLPPLAQLAIEGNNLSDKGLQQVTELRDLVFLSLADTRH